MYVMRSSHGAEVTPLSGGEIHIEIEKQHAQQGEQAAKSATA